MRWDALTAACAVGLIAVTVGATERDSLPQPWFRTGTASPAAACRTAGGTVAGPGFDRALVIRCAGTKDGFVTVMQQIAADDYRGRRVRLSARLRGEAVAGWSGVWMRVDGDQGRVIAFDNMQSRALKGTFGWQRADVVLDVAPEARLIAFGVLQSGDGTTSTGDLALDVVDASVATTGARGAGSIPKRPVNLSLEP